jgi:hypothetical protein
MVNLLYETDETAECKNFSTDFAAIREDLSTVTSEINLPSIPTVNTMIRDGTA